jgi:DNA repair photolyase
MRWDNLRLDEGTMPASPARELPLIERGAVARTFDTPGFRGMTFYEVQARSIVNRVPESSRMAFTWTINPYRGCQHACVYCMSGETPILMADGRTKPLADVRAGDEIYGTTGEGSARRYAVTTVSAHWSTVKPAYRVVLADGTQLVCSGDHRFLTERGWKYVTRAPRGTARRPVLTAHSKLAGTGAFADPPKQAEAYRRGYLCGMIRGTGVPVRQFQPALADPEAAARTASYLSGARAGGRDIERVISWPAASTAEWRRGFLAGIFDAEGSCDGGVLRISDADPATVERLTSCLDTLGFRFAAARAARQHGLVNVRLLGGVSETMRYFHATDPAVTRKRSIADVTVRSDARLRVAAIEPLGLDLPMYDITTGTGDFIANGVVSHNCFARNTHTYLDLDAGADFNSRVVVKVNAPELLRRKLASPGWQGEHIAMGTNVDCYQRAEGKYRLMPGIISALRDFRNPFSILTKGTLILRDIDLLESAAAVTSVGLNVSAGFADESLWRSAEPGTPAPARRLEVCATLNDRGLPCGVLMGPVIPYLSDSPRSLDATVRAIAAAGAVHITPIVLHLRPGAREWFFAWLRENHPGLVARYEELYGRRAYAPKAYQARISGQVRELAAKYGIGRSGAGRSGGGRSGGGRFGAGRSGGGRFLPRGGGGGNAVGGDAVGGNAVGGGTAPRADEVPAAGCPGEQLTLL